MPVYVDSGGNLYFAASPTSVNDQQLLTGNATLIAALTAVSPTPKRVETDVNGVITLRTASYSPSGISVRYTTDGTGVQKNQIFVNGDSFEARHCTDLDTGTFTAAQVGGVATITQASHGVMPGTVIHIGGWTDPYWNGYFIVDASTLAANTFTFAIDSRASAVPVAGNYTPNITIPSQRLATGFMNWAEWLTGMDFNYKNIALGSRKSAEMVTEFEADYQQAGPGSTIIFGGFTNDCNQLVPTATSAANLAALIQAAQIKNINVVLMTIPPFAAPAYSATKANLILALNAVFRAYALLYKCELWDWHELGCDPAGNDTLLSGLFDSGDGLHPTPLYYKMLAEAYVIPYLLAKGYGSPMPLIASTGDVRATLASSNNLLPLMTGSGGGFAGGATGSAVTGTTTTNSALTSVTASVTTSTVGSKQVFDIVSAGSGSFTWVGGDIKASLTAGKKYVFYGKVNVESPVAFRLSLWMKLSTASANANIQACANQGIPLPMPAGNYSMTFQTDPAGALFPSGMTLTLAQFNTQFASHVAGNTRLSYELLAFRELP